MRMDVGGMLLTEVIPSTRRGVTCYRATLSAYSERDFPGEHVVQMGTS